MTFEATISIGHYLSGLFHFFAHQHWHHKPLLGGLKFGARDDGRDGIGGGVRCRCLPLRGFFGDATPFPLSN